MTVAVAGDTVLTQSPEDWQSRPSSMLLLGVDFDVDGKLGRLSRSIESVVRRHAG